jgi:hypothetical protein
LFDDSARALAACASGAFLVMPVCPLTSMG